MAAPSDPFPNQEGYEYEDEGYGGYDDDGASMLGRTAKACDGCHRTKSKCLSNGTNPCPACVRKGIPCVYSAAKKRGPKTGALRAMQQEVEVLRQQLRSLVGSQAVGGVTGASEGGKAPSSKRARKSTPAQTSETASTVGPIPFPASGTRSPAAPPSSSSSNSSASAGAGVGVGTSTAHVYTPLPYATFIPVYEEPRIAPLQMEVRFIRLYFLYCNALLPMVCKTCFYHCGLRLGLLDMLGAVCEDTVPLCDHKRGDCAAMTFISFEVAKTLFAHGANEGECTDVSSLVAAAKASANDSDTRILVSESYDPPRITMDPQPVGGPRVPNVYTTNADTRPKRVVTMTPQQLAAMHMTQLPEHMRTPEANSPKQLSAAKACYYGVLALGARMDMQPERADAYLARCREALSLAWDEPCVETICACMLLGYYTCGCASNGDMLRSKCYISLANEMTDGLEISASALLRRAHPNAFSAVNPDAGTSPSGTPGGGGSSSSGGTSGGVVGGAESTRSSRGSHTTHTGTRVGIPAPHPSRIPPAATATSGSSSRGGSGSGSKRSHAAAFPKGGLAVSSASAVDSPLCDVPPITTYSTLIPGLPLDIVLSVRFLAQLTSAYRSASGALATRGDEWDSPRGKVSRILAYVTTKTRRRVSTPEDLRKIAPSLMAALAEAEAIVIANKAGGCMDFATLATIETSRAVVLHAYGDNERAFACVQKGLGLMDNDFRPLTNYFVMGILVQLIPVCIAVGRNDCVNTVMQFLTDLARMWPVGHVLLAKAQRRIQYCTSRSNPEMSRGSMDATAGTSSTGASASHGSGSGHGGMPIPTGDIGSSSFASGGFGGGGIRLAPTHHTTRPNRSLSLEAPSPSLSTHMGSMGNMSPHMGAGEGGGYSATAAAAVNVTAAAAAARRGEALTPLDHLAAITETFAEPVADEDNEGVEGGYGTHSHSHHPHALMGAQVHDATTSTASVSSTASGGGSGSGSGSGSRTALRPVPSIGTSFTVTPSAFAAAASGSSSGFGQVPSGGPFAAGTAEASRTLSQYPSAHGVIVPGGQQGGGYMLMGPGSTSAGYSSASAWMPVDTSARHHHPSTPTSQYGLPPHHSEMAASLASDSAFDLFFDDNLFEGYPLPSPMGIGTPLGGSSYLGGGNNSGGGGGGGGGGFGSHSINGNGTPSFEYKPPDMQVSGGGHSLIPSFNLPPLSNSNLSLPTSGGASTTPALMGGVEPHPNPNFNPALHTNGSGVSGVGIGGMHASLLESPPSVPFSLSGVEAPIAAGPGSSLMMGRGGFPLRSVSTGSTNT